MLRLLVHLRTMQMFNHSAHNLVSGSTFLQDHELFAELYGAASDNYDSVAERLIGLVGPKTVNLAQIMNQVAEKCQGLPSEGNANVLFSTSLKLEQELCSIIWDYISAKAIMKNVAMTEGTRQMLGDICDKSETRQYKLKQRLK